MIGARKRSRKLFENGEPLQHGVGHALATPASEGKRVHEHGADLLVQFIAHEPPCAMQPRLHCIRLNSSVLMPSITRVMNTIRNISGRCRSLSRQAAEFP